MVSDSLRTTHVIHVGDTQTPLAVTLSRADGSLPNLDGKTVTFKAVDIDGDEAIAETAAGVTVDGSTRTVRYDFAAADVDTARILFGYFVVTDESGERETFPAESRALAIEVQGD
jgi:hypothetical protein